MAGDSGFISSLADSVRRLQDAPGSTTGVADYSGQIRGRVVARSGNHYTVATLDANGVEVDQVKGCLAHAGSYEVGASVWIQFDANRAAPWIMGSGTATTGEGQGGYIGFFGWLG